jgi:hypothetical protein
MWCRNRVVHVLTIIAAALAKRGRFFLLTRDANQNTAENSWKLATQIDGVTNLKKRWPLADLT